jgi:LTXXQ motif family protein
VTLTSCGEAIAFRGDFHAKSDICWNCRTLSRYWRFHSLSQDPSVGSPSQHVTAANLNALTDARVAIVKGTLQLTPDQDKYWPAIEEAIRARAKNRLTRLENITTGAAERADRSPLEVMRDRNPVEFLNRRSDALAQRAADLKKLAAAWQPLYQTLMPDQKRRLGLLTVIAIRELRDRAEQRRMQAADEDEEN